MIVVVHTHTRVHIIEQKWRSRSELSKRQLFNFVSAVVDVVVDAVLVKYTRNVIKSIIITGRIILDELIFNRLQR